MPRSPIVDSGHIYPLKMHGTIVYLTLWETAFNYIAFFGGGVAALYVVDLADRIRRARFILRVNER
jgi:hypothetical protein